MDKIFIVNKQISIDYDIKSMEWIDDGSKIMLWLRLHECDDSENPRDNNNWNNEYQIQVSID